MKTWRHIPRATAIVLAAVFLGEIVHFVLTDDDSLKGFDYLFLAVVAVVLVLTIFAKKIATKVAATSLIALLVLILGELSLGWIIGHKHHRESAWYVWPPHHTTLLRPENLIGVSPEGKFTTNSMGMRGPEFSPNDKLRVLCVGGSTTECLYLDDTKEWPALLRRELDPSGGAWVGNVGRSGHTTSEHLVLLTHLPEAKQVDGWIILCGVNDMGQLLRGEFDAADDLDLSQVFSFRLPGLFHGDLRRPWHRNLHLYVIGEALRKKWKVRRTGGNAAVVQDMRGDWIRSLREHRHSGAKRSELPPLNPLLDTYQSNIQRIIQLARQRGVPVMFITQPTIWSDSMTPEQQSLLVGGRAGKDDYYDPAALDAAMRAFNERLQKVCAAEKVACLDLAAITPKSREIYYDDCHFNENGAKHVAKAVADAVRAQQWKAIQKRES